MVSARAPFPANVSPELACAETPNVANRIANIVMLVEAWGPATLSVRAPLPVSVSLVVAWGPAMASVMAPLAAGKAASTKTALTREIRTMLVALKRNFKLLNRSVVQAALPAAVAKKADL